MSLILKQILDCHLLLTLSLFTVTVKLENVLLTVETNDLKSEVKFHDFAKNLKNHFKVIFHCLPVLRDVIEPTSIDIEIKWFADGENILSQVVPDPQKGELFYVGAKSNIRTIT